jgi:Domain of unknown function (DUF4124)
MHNGMTRALAGMLMVAISFAAHSAGEIYKVVDEDGNVTYTDERPKDGTPPMDLPPLSVIETDIQVPAPADETVQAAEQAKPPTMRDLQRQFGDFRITQPQQEETFWGTANTVVVAWGTAQAVPPELSARMFVDGAPRSVPPNGSLSLTLDRGEHQVYVELLDARGRRIITTETVVFFVKQASVGFLEPGSAPRRFGP